MKRRGVTPPRGMTHVLAGISKVTLSGYVHAPTSAADSPKAARESTPGVRGAGDRSIITIGSRQPGETVPRGKSGRGRWSFTVWKYESPEGIRDWAWGRGMRLDLEGSHGVPLRRPPSGTERSFRDNPWNTLIATESCRT